MHRNACSLRSDPRRRRKRLFATVVASALAALLGALATAGTAAAMSSPIHLTTMVNIRPTPDTSRAPVGTIPQGASPDFHCFTYGQNINGVNVWFNVTQAGVTGYYASFYDDAHYSSEAQLRATYGIPKCGATPTPPPATSAAERAIGWMNARLGSTQYDSYCLAAVYQAYLAAGINITAGLASGPSHGSAYTYWTVARNRHLGDRNVPRGGLVFFRSAAGAPGHVAISLGGGRMISTYDGRTHAIHTMAISSYDPSRFLGWVGV
jgi:cell wall-associated NlpC family hydrolase